MARSIALWHRPKPATRLTARSLDVQTYIWHADLTGLYLAHQLLEVADRGVRVRLLVDDMDARAKNAGLAALAAHPKVSVRLFNPFASRSGTLAKVSEGFGSFGRLNRRMRNKGWIADTGRAGAASKAEMRLTRDIRSKKEVRRARF